MRYLAIDHGQKRSGLAVCDAGQQIASPLCVVENQKLLERIRQAVDEYRIEAIVIGLPYNMDGTEGPRAEEVRKFAKQLSKKIPLPQEFFDERLSSFDAQEKLIAMEASRKQKKQRIDALAAAAILQAFLDSKKHLNESE